MEKFASEKKESIVEKKYKTRECQRRAAAKYIAKHLDEIKEKQRIKYAEHKEEILESQRDYYAKNPEKMRNCSKRYYEANREKILDRRRIARIMKRTNTKPSNPLKDLVENGVIPKSIYSVAPNDS